MLKYLIIQLDDTAPSYCCYSINRHRPRQIPIDVLRAGILFGMKENLMVQYVLPDYELPKEYIDAMQNVDNCKIASISSPYATIAEVLIINKWESTVQFVQGKTYVLRMSKKEFFENSGDIKNRLKDITRLNIVITDIDGFTDDEFDVYKKVLSGIAKQIQSLCIEGVRPQLNLLTDRIMLDRMNNCNAGSENITLAPDGRFYVCPAFYYENGFSIGSISDGVDIKNRQLYRIAYAPLCRNCDAYQCRRCVWLNHKTTCEVNTPSHEQCVVSHIERNVSRELLINMQKDGVADFYDKEIKDISYLDPFDVRNEW